MTDVAPFAKPPYPMIGELCRLVARAFDTKAADPEAAKKLDRLAREGDFDWSLSEHIKEKLILKPLRKMDDEFALFVQKRLRLLLHKHLGLISAIRLDALSREEAFPLLLELTGATCVAAFIISLKDSAEGPDLGDFLNRESIPLNVVFQWAEAKLGLEVGKIAFADDKQKRDEIARWRRGETLPDFFGSVLPLIRDLKFRCPEKASQISQFAQWVVTARALAWLKREADEAGYTNFWQLVRQQILLNCPERDIEIRLSEANNLAGDRLSELSTHGLLLREKYLKRTQKKALGDMRAAREELERFVEITEKLAPDGRTRYLLDWCEGRWHVLAGKEAEALTYYERSADHALYRAGPVGKEILEEALSLAAHLRNRPAIKRLKHRALTMGLFSTVAAELPEVTSGLADWEVEPIAQTFPLKFPAHGRFPEAPERPDTWTRPLIPATHLANTDKIKPDLKRPNRVIGIPGSGRRMPQLIWFASEDKADEVLSLLEAGANIDIAGDQGGSALLNALQCTDNGRGRKALDLLLGQPHKSETLDRLTKRKRLSPLYQAVLLGDPDVVAKLLAMGATADQAASFPPQTPLYVCAGRFGLYRSSPNITMTMRERFRNPSPEDREVLRRFMGGMVGVMGQDIPSLEAMSARYQKIFEKVGQHLIEKATQQPRESFAAITGLLLTHGADPNRKHPWPGPGRTPLMVAAENNALDAFKLMLNAGGDPYLKDDQGNDCTVIARGFGSRDVQDFLHHL